jgi:hypothetical protein
VGRLSNDQRLALGRALVPVGQPDEAMQVWGARRAWRGRTNRPMPNRVPQPCPGRLPAARQAAREWKHTWPLSPVALYQAGILDLLDQTQEARRDLEECRRLDEDFAGRVNTLLEAYPEQGGEDAYAYLKAGRALADLGEWDLAPKPSDVLALEPAYAEAWALLGESRQQLARMVIQSSSRLWSSTRAPPWCRCGGVVLAPARSARAGPGLSAPGSNRGRKNRYGRSKWVTPSIIWGTAA